MAKRIDPRNADLRRQLLPGNLDLFLQEPWATETVALLSPRTLAYVGDAVYELGLRLRHVLNDVDSSGRLHASIVKLVCADHQARLFDLIFSRAQDDEQALLKTWRNTKLPHRSAGGSRKAYAKSTAFEAWVGLLFLRGDRERLNEVFDLAENPDQEEADHADEEPVAL